MQVEASAYDSGTTLTRYPWLRFTTAVVPIAIQLVHVNYGFKMPTLKCEAIKDAPFGPCNSRKAGQR